MKKTITAAISIIGVAGIALGAGAAYIKVRKETKKANNSKVVVENNKLTVDISGLNEELRDELIETVSIITGEATEDEDGNFVKLEVEEEASETLKEKGINFVKNHKKLVIMLGAGLFALLGGVILAKRKGINRSTVLAFLKGGGSKGDCSVDSCGLDLDIGETPIGETPVRENIAPSYSSSGLDLSF